MKACINILLFAGIMLIGTGCDLVADKGFQMEITGTITSALDGAPIPNVVVTLSGAFPPAFGSIEDVSVSDAEGRYVINLQIDEGCPSMMSFRVERRGYIPQALQVSPGPAPITCRARPQRYDIVLNTKPIVESVNPSVVLSTWKNITLVVTGQNFTATSLVKIGDFDWQPVYVEEDGTQLLVPIDATRLNTGWYDLSVFDNTDQRYLYAIGHLPNALEVR